jgi:hypothetical protein
MPGMASVEASKPTVEIARALLLPKPTSRGLGHRPQYRAAFARREGFHPGKPLVICARFRNRRCPIRGSLHQKLDIAGARSWGIPWWGGFLDADCVNPDNTGNALDGVHLVQGDLRGCR